MADPSRSPDRPEYYVQTGSMFDNPYGVPHDEIVAMILELPAEMAAQVVFGKYVESSGLVFSGELIQMMIDRDLPRITGDRWHDEEAVRLARTMSFERKRAAYATGIDFARLNDFTALLTLDVRTRPGRLVGYRRLNRVPWEGIYREVGRVAGMFGPSILADSTGMAGDVILSALEDRMYCPIHDRIALREHGVCMANGQPVGGCRPDQFILLNCVDGYAFTRSSKQALLEHLRSILSVGYRARSDETFGWVRTPPIVQIEEEMSFYSWDDKGLDTDTVMALALAAWQGIEMGVGDSYVGSPYGS